MSVARLSRLQWFGLLAGGIAWAAEFLAGAGASQAVCNPASGRWGIPHDALQLALMSFGAAVVLAAGAAAFVVWRETRDAGHEGSRLHLFATFALLGNLLFLVIILLTGIATIVDRTCQQA
jgi:hypothetical protein